MGCKRQAPALFQVKSWKLPHHTSERGYSDTPDLRAREAGPCGFYFAGEGTYVSWRWWLMEPVYVCGDISSKRTVEPTGGIFDLRPVHIWLAMFRSLFFLFYTY